MSRLVPTGARLAAPAVLVLLTAAGCSTRGLGHVRGTVTVGGKPVTAGRVVFFADDPPWSADGPLTAAGEYYIPAVPTGPVRAAVLTKQFRPTRAPAAGPRVNRRPGTSDADGPGKVYVPTPERCETPDTSGLAFEVGRGNQTIDIALPTE